MYQYHVCVSRLVVTSDDLLSRLCFSHVSVLVTSLFSVFVTSVLPSVFVTFAKSSYNAVGFFSEENIGQIKLVKSTRAVRYNSRRVGGC